MNLKSNNFVTVVNMFSKYLKQLGFSFKYSESQERYSKKTRTESRRTSGMSVQVFENVRQKQIALVLSDDRQLPLRFFAGFSLSNQGFIPVVEIVSGSGSKDYSNQIKELSKVSLTAFAQSVDKSLDLLDNLSNDMAARECNIPELLDNMVNYRNSFSETSKLAQLVYTGTLNNSNGLCALIVVCSALFQGKNVVKPRHYKGVFKKYSKFNGLTQLRYKFLITDKLINEILQ